MASKTKVSEIINYLNDYLISHNLKDIDPVRANSLLQAAGILKDSKSRPGKPLRELLREGLITHAYQPDGKNSRWIIPVSNPAPRENEMNNKKIYIWKLAEFLSNHSMKMSGEELAKHLNRNNFFTGYGTEFKGGRGTYALISNTWNWLNIELGLPKEAEMVADAYVNASGRPAYKV